MSRRILYELVSKEGYSFSPYVFRSKALLNYKGLEYEPKQLGFVQIHEQVGEVNPKKQVPVLVDGDDIVSDSDNIYNFLEKKYPEPSVPKGDLNFKDLYRYAPPLAMPKLLPLLKDEDKDYFRGKTEKAIGKKIEEALQPQVYEQNLKKWREATDKMSNLISDQSEITYTALQVAGVLHWISFSIGEEETFGNNKKLEKWFKDLKNKVKVN
ncbi:glutathione S-transferase zeta class protein [Acrasis kona]|uniref:Glutathione S-transferase zeta class protein n=1 Tax=Acrasis kona TaxID=1008807 RepID=A0AAW2Z7A5_9EUKA